MRSRKESVWESVELRSMNASVCEPIEGRSMQESVCESGESVWGLSLRALHARAGGDHNAAQLWRAKMSILAEEHRNL